MRHDRQGREGRGSRGMWAWGLLLLILALPAPAAPPRPSSHAPAPVLLQPGQVRIAPVASTRRHLPGHYVYRDDIYAPNGLATGPDGSLFFIAGMGGQQAIMRLGPGGHITPWALSPQQGIVTADNGQREAVYDEFDHLAVTPAGRVYTLFDGSTLYEVGPHNALRFVPLKDPAGRPLPDPDQLGYRKGGYPEFQALAASPDGRLYLKDAKWIYWMSPDEILHPLIQHGGGPQSGFVKIDTMTVDIHGVIHGITYRQVEVSRITPQGTVKTVRAPLAAAFAIAAGPHGYVYVTGTRRTEHSRIRVYRISPQGQAELLAPQLPKLTGSIAIDSHGNLYVTSADTIYRLSPREQP